MVSPVAFDGLPAAAYRCRQGASLSELPEAAAPLMEPGRSSAATREPEHSSAGARQVQRSAAPEVLAQRVPRLAEEVQCAPLEVAAEVAVSSDVPPAAVAVAAPDEAAAQPQAAEAVVPGEQGVAAEVAARDEAAAQRQAAGVLDGAAGLRAAGPSASACRRDQALPWPALLPAGRFARARHLPRIAWP